MVLHNSKSDLPLGIGISFDLVDLPAIATYDIVGQKSRFFRKVGSEDQSYR